MYIYRWARPKSAKLMYAWILSMIYVRMSFVCVYTPAHNWSTCVQVEQSHAGTTPHRRFGVNFTAMGRQACSGNPLTSCLQVEQAMHAGTTPHRRFGVNLTAMGLQACSGNPLTSCLQVEQSHAGTTPHCRFGVNLTAMGRQECSGNPLTS